LSRSEVAQRMPEPGRDLTGFPADEVNGGAVFRAHNIGLRPWYFASSGGGRFDLQAPRGTCYAADSVRTAVRERLGDTVIGRPFVAASVADAMQVSVIGLPPGRYADTSAEGGEDFGVTSELAVMVDYTVTRAWADAFAAHAFHGIHYESRYTTGRGPRSWALFGSSGADATRPVFEDQTLDGRAACAGAGLTVLVAPTRRSLNVIDPGSGLS
jgi:hypothetical protein